MIKGKRLKPPFAPAKGGFRRFFLEASPTEFFANDYKRVEMEGGLSDTNLRFGCNLSPRPLCEVVTLFGH